MALSRSPALLAPSERVLGRHLDEDQGEAVGITRDHLEEAPRLELGLLGDHDAFLRLQLLPEGAEIAHLEEEANCVGGWVSRGARDLEKTPAAEEEDDAVLAPAPPLVVDGEAERLLVEAGVSARGLVGGRRRRR